MKRKLLILSTMVLGALGTQASLAQSGTASQLPSATTPATRSDVRDQTAPTGSAKAPSRNEVKSEALRAQNAGEIPKGDAATTRSLEKHKAATDPAKSRQEVKAQVPGDRSPARAEFNKEKNEPKSATGLR